MVHYSHMSRMRLVVGCMLLAAIPGVAAAEDLLTSKTDQDSPAIIVDPTRAPHAQHTKKTRKVEILLGQLGLNSKEVMKLVSEVDARVDKGYLRLAEERVPGGTLTLHYDLSGGVRAKQIELKFQPDDSNWQATARPNAVMVEYKYKF
jgi:hypothetical protein